MNPDPVPPIIQGGMGVAVSGWRLARAVAATGQLGVVSGTALDVVHARILGDGDPGGHLRLAYAAFPLPEVAERVLARWYVEGGRQRDEPYRRVPLHGARSNRATAELTVLASFAEVWLAKRGHGGPVGINLLQKVQIPTIFTLFGAMAADVDVVVMGAGIPTSIPRLLDDLARGRHATHHVDLESGTDGFDVDLDPEAWWGWRPQLLARPRFLAVVSSHTLAAFLARDPHTCPDGFVVEGPTAGGHNAPPRGRPQLDPVGQPVYGPRDAADLDRIADLGLPFWLAGGFGLPGALGRARRSGAEGIQVGTAFALCEESGLAPGLKAAAIAQARAEALVIRTDPLASPSGYPFKIAAIEGTVASAEVYQARRRVCDLGFLRVAFRRDDGSIGFRCPSEPVDTYVRKGGKVEDTIGRVCLCNGLTTSVGIGQLREAGAEPPLVTLGDDAAKVVAALAPESGGWSAADVVRLLLAAEEDLPAPADARSRPLPGRPTGSPRGSGSLP
jgi:NAD(P)H-dependent flavin oxidoreductase YrpB (nitropropane dioxygenase family)